jgi:hypothetical protein
MAWAAAGAATASAVDGNTAAAAAADDLVEGKGSSGTALSLLPVDIIVVESVAVPAV